MRPALPTLLALLVLAAPARAYEHVRRVVDGDTVVRLSGETVRVVGLDAPETRARCEAERRRAASATVRTRELVAGGVDYRMPRIGRTEDRYGWQLSPRSTTRLSNALVVRAF